MTGWRQSLVGRGVELERLSDLLSANRLVTVTGPGGSGKTSLAVDFARRIGQRFLDGVVVVELGHLEDPGLVPSAVAAAVGARESAGSTASDSLAVSLADRHLLVVLDSCEHLVEAAAALSDAILTGTDGVAIVATSREPLRVAAEVRLALGPLPVPPLGAAVTAGAFDAVDLFVARARQVDGSFELNDSNAAYVSEIVRRLDGLPLAIELAAARIGGLSVRQVASRLTNSSELLVSRMRGRPPRMASITATTAWSYRLLSVREQEVFRRLSLFAAPFTGEAACVAAGPDTRDVATDLVEKSLLVSASPGTDDRLRFSMLHTIREFGRTQLGGDGGAVTARRAVAEWYAAAAQHAAEGLERVDDEAAATLWFDAEYENIVAAIEWRHDEPTIALRLATTLAPWLLMRGRFTEARVLVHRALSVSGAPCTELHARGLLELARAQYAIAELSSGLDTYLQARDVAAACGCRRVEIDAHLGASAALRNLGQLELAEAEATSAAALADRVEDQSAQAMAAVAQGYVAHYRNQHEQAYGHATRAHAISGRLRPADYDLLVCLLVWTCESTGRRDEAIRYARHSLRRACERGSRSQQARSSGMLGEILFAHNAPQEARTHLESALTIAMDTGERFLIWQALAVIAQAGAEAGLGDQALAAMAAAEALRRRLHIFEAARYRAIVEAATVQAGRGLDNATRNLAWEHGSHLSLDAAVDLARSILLQVTQAEGEAAQPELTPRERQLVALVAQGMTDKQIAAHLFISLRTVRSHLDRIRDKTGCRRRADLTRLALAHQASA